MIQRKETINLLAVIYDVILTIFMLYSWGTLYEIWGIPANYILTPIGIIGIIKITTHFVTYTFINEKYYMETKE